MTSKFSDLSSAQQEQAVLLAFQTIRGLMKDKMIISDTPLTLKQLKDMSEAFAMDMRYNLLGNVIKFQDQP